MSNLTAEVAYPAANPIPPAVLSPGTRPTGALTKILLVQFRKDRPIGEHPELQNLIADGWRVRSASPRLVESEGPKLLVVLAKPEAGARLTRIK